MLRKFLQESGIARKDFFIVFILLFNTFTWWYIIPVIIDDSLSLLNVTHIQNLTIWIAYYLAIIGSCIVGSTFSHKIKRLKFLYLWIILGIVVSPLPALFNNLSVMHVLVFSILLGVSFGLGVPACLAYFADWTRVENRGKIGGIVLLTINLSAPLFAISFEMFNLTINSIILAVWRGFGLIIFLLKPEENIVSERKKNPSFASILRDRAFLLYFVAWLMFCLIDRFEWPILRHFFGDFYYLMLMIGPIIGSLSAFIGGVFSDRVGRKRVVLYGFVTLGIAYAIIGISPAASFSWYFYLVVDSIATGILWITFILILWGDLSESGFREKYYAIGGIPYFLTYIVQLLSAPYVTLIPETSAFSVAAFFLFLAVLPLLYAPETLPERKIKLRQLRKYVEAARKVKEKHE